MTTLPTHLLPLFDRLADGNVLQLLSHDGFDAAAHLLPINRIVDHLRRLAGPRGSPPDAARLKVIGRRNAIIVARRLLLGRHAEELKALHNLWTAFGTPDDAVRTAATAARCARDNWPVGGSLPFSSAHADFIMALDKLQQIDKDGPIGLAVHQSRYRGMGSEDRPGEELHVGFPAMLGGAPGLRAAVWVEPDSRDGWPIWEDGPDDSPCPGLRRQWDELHSGLQGMDEVPPRGRLSPVWKMHLPEWLALQVVRSGGKVELPSAGLAVLMQCLAETQKRPLPAGIAFTGRVVFGHRDRWEDVRVRAVNGIAEKAWAAQEEGVFLLFACRDADSSEPAPSVPGVQVVWIKPESTFEELLQKVNTTCSQSGLTEYRRRGAADRVHERLCSAGNGKGYASALLTDALDKQAFPFGVAERVEEQRCLQQARDTTAKGRSLVYLVGGPRQGKTTLLSSWLRSGDWPRLPAWYSLRRQSGAAESVTELRRAILEQLASTFLVVRSPRYGDTLEALDRLTKDRVEVVIDGLDEVELSQRVAALDFLRALPGNGIAVVGTQDVPKGYEASGLKVNLESSWAAAYHVIRGFAEKFRESPSLRDIGLRLSSTKWREGLAQQAGGNPWVVKEFLRAIDEDRWGWPDSPEEARLTPDVRAYCGVVLQEVLASGEAAPYAAEVRALVNGLALLDNRPWPLADALYLLGLPHAPGDLARWQQALTAKAVPRLMDVSTTGLQVHFRDATFREFLGTDDALERGLLERMLPLLGTGPLPAGTGRSLRDSAVREVARHAIRVGADVPHLVRQLLFETDWAFHRLHSLVATGLSIGEMLSELVTLSGLILDQRLEEREAINALRLSLTTWQEPIKRGGIDASQWWAALAGVQQHMVWRRQGTREVRNASVPLLAPVGSEEGPGYRTPSRLIDRLGDAACELPDGTLVLTSEAGHLLVLTFDATSRKYGKPKRRWAELKAIHQVTAVGYRQVLVLGIDYDERQRLSLVDLASESVRLWIPDAATSRLFACEALDVPGEGPGESAVLLAGVEGERIRVSVWRAGVEVASEVLPFGPYKLDSQERSGLHRNLVVTEALPFGLSEHHLRHGHGVVRLSPTTWAAWGAQGEGEDRRFQFSMRQWRDGKFVEIADPNITVEMTDWPEGVCAGPDGRVALFSSEDDGSAAVVAFEADGSFTELLTIRPAKDSGEQDDSTEYRAENYYDTTPVVWHDRLGLIVDHDVGAFSIRPAPEALPQKLPMAWWGLPTFDVPRRGRRLAGGRALLIYNTFGIVVEP